MKIGISMFIQQMPCCNGFSIQERKIHRSNGKECVTIRRNRSDYGIKTNWNKTEKKENGFGFVFQMFIFVIRIIIRIR